MRSTKRHGTSGSYNLHVIIWYHFFNVSTNIKPCINYSFFGNFYITEVCPKSFGIKRFTLKLYADFNNMLLIIFVLKTMLFYYRIIDGGKLRSPKKHEYILFLMLKHILRRFDTILAISGPNSDPIATPSVCWYNSLLYEKGVFLVHKYKWSDFISFLGISVWICWSL